MNGDYYSLLLLFNRSRITFSTKLHVTLSSLHIQKIIIIQLLVIPEAALQ